VFCLNSVEILTWNLKKKLFQENFSEILCKLGYPLLKVVEFRPTFCNFILGPYCAEKMHTSTFICCLHPGKEVRHKQITKRRYWEEKLGRFVFGKPVLFILGVGLTTPYCLGILV